MEEFLPREYANTLFSLATIYLPLNKRSHLLFAFFSYLGLLLHKKTGRHQEEGGGLQSFDDFRGDEGLS